MTVTELHTNGGLTQERGRAIVRDTPNPTRPQLARRWGMSESWWRDRIREVRNEAADAVPPRVANVPGEAPPVARSTVTPVTRPTSPNVRRQRVLVALMVAIGTVVAGAVGTLAYSLTVNLASAAGTGWHAYVLPVALDGMYLCGAICLAVDNRYRPAKLAIGVGLVASMATQWVAADDPADVVDLEVVARTLSAFTPLCLFLCVVFILHAYKVRR